MGLVKKMKKVGGKRWFFVIVEEDEHLKEMNEKDYFYMILAAFINPVIPKKKNPENKVSKMQVPREMYSTNTV